MRIIFERTGGFTGIALRTTVQTEALPETEADELCGMVDSASFFDLPTTIRSPARGADQFEYRLTVEADQRRHTIQVGDTAAPDSLQPLLRRLTLLARSRRGL